MKFNRKIIGKIVIVSVILLVTALVVGLNIYTKVENAKGNTLPMPFGIGIVHVETGSMEPNIPTHSLAVVVSAKNYEIGDVVAYQTELGKIHTVHRIVEMDGDIIVTCGDNNDGSKDPPIHKSQIKGKVLFHIPGAGQGMKSFSKFMRHPVVIVLVLLVAGALMFLSLRSTPKDENKDVDAIKAEIERLKAGQGNSPAADTPTGEAPPTEAPPAEAPPTEAPPAEAPPAEAPPTEAPPAEAPPTEAPPAEAPPADEPPSD